MNKPSGLAIVGYGLTATGFVQVAVTIAPRVAATIPDAGPVANIAGAAIALSVDVVWAALMHTTLQTYRNGQPRPALGFGAATLAAVAASTALLAAVGHMGPWSVVPILAAILLVADGIREHVSVSPETATTIRNESAAIRDARALAVIEARAAAHEETLNGYREAARLVARTEALTHIKCNVQRADARARNKIERATKKHGDASERFAELFPPPKPPEPEPVNIAALTEGKPLNVAIRIARTHLGMLATDEEIADAIGVGERSVATAYAATLGKAKIASNKRRALKLDATHEDYTWDELLAKCNETCGICNTWLDTTLHGVEPDSVSLDHIHPLSAGGSNTLDNVHLTHLSCNLSKGTKPLETKSTSLELVSAPVSQLTGDQIDAEIREMIGQGMSSTQIAEELQMHRTTVYRRIKAMSA